MPLSSFLLKTLSVYILCRSVVPLVMYYSCSASTVTLGKRPFAHLTRSHVSQGVRIPGWIWVHASLHWYCPPNDQEGNTILVRPAVALWLCIFLCFCFSFCFCSCFCYRLWWSPPCFVELLDLYIECTLNRSLFYFLFLLLL